MAIGVRSCPVFDLFAWEACVVEPLGRLKRSANAMRKLIVLLLVSITLHSAAADNFSSRLRGGGQFFSRLRGGIKFGLKTAQRIYPLRSTNFPVWHQPLGINDMIWRTSRITKQNRNYSTVIPTKPFVSRVFRYHPCLKYDDSWRDEKSTNMLKSSVHVSKDVCTIRNETNCLF